MYIICYLHKGTKENKNGRIVSWNYDPAKVFLQRAITIIYSQHHPFDTDTSKFSSPNMKTDFALFYTQYHSFYIKNNPKYVN